MKSSRKGRDELLKAAGLDVAFERAEGDLLTWTHPTRGKRHVLDLVGGFGATLLGHNHPELVTVVVEHLQRRGPILVQGSRRAPSRELTCRLAELLRGASERDFEVLLLNTGTEAVEAARKHALLELSRRLQARREQIEGDLNAMRRALKSRDLVLDRAFFQACEQVLGGYVDSVEGLVAALAHANRRVLTSPGHFIALRGAFHGKTLGALELTWNPEARRPFVRGAPRVTFLQPGEQELEELVAAHAGSLVRLDLSQRRLVREPVDLVAGIFVEPIQGEGGVRPLDQDLVRALAEVRRRHPDVPLVVDEIQTGLGRTGRLFEGFARGLAADYVTLGKALGGGVAKLSALAVARDRFIPEFTTLHSSTYAEDELSSAVGLRALELVEREAICSCSQQLGQALREVLEALQQRWPGQIAAVRGQGAMIGLELHPQHDNSSNVIRALAEEEHLILMVAGYLLHEHDLRVLPTLGDPNTLRLEPSARLDHDELPLIVSALERVCEILARSNAHRLLRHLVCEGPLEPHEPVASFVTDDERLERSREPRARAAFMGHFINVEHLPLFDPSLVPFSPQELQRLLDHGVGLIRPWVYSRRIVRSATGAETELSFIGIWLSSEQVMRDMVQNRGRATRGQVADALELAKQIGCSVVGFGGFTSIVSRNCMSFSEPHVALTTGNALTVGMGHEAVLSALEKEGLRLSRLRAAVCGAAGNIGQVYACLLACEVDHLTLVGSPGSLPRLEAAAGQVACELARAQARRARGGGLLARFCDVMIAQPNHHGGIGVAMLKEYEERAGTALVELSESVDDLATAELIVTASNRPSPIIRSEHVRDDGPVLICDVAVPGDVDPAVPRERPQARVIRGGVVALQQNPDFSIPGIPLPLGQTFACLGETIVMGLSGVGIDYSRGPICTDQVREIVKLAQLHGVVLGSYKVQPSI